MAGLSKPTKQSTPTYIKNYIKDRDKKIRMAYGNMQRWMNQIEAAKKLLDNKSKPKPAKKKKTKKRKG